MDNLFTVFQTLLPIILLTGLGWALSRLRFFGPGFISDLNKLAFWIALPCLVFRSLARAELPGLDVWSVIAVGLAFTLSTAILILGACLALRMPRAQVGTVIQGAFRGNLAYAGFPIIFFAWNDLPQQQFDDLASRVLLVFAPMMILYNLLSIVALQASRPDRSPGILRTVALPIVRNPLIIASALGIGMAVSDLSLPVPLDRSLEAMANFALPAALLSIGGGLTLNSVSAQRKPVVLGVVGKLAIAPLLAGLLCALFSLGPDDTRIILVFSACPTAVVSYIMAAQMGGDTDVSTAIISLTTILSVLPLTAVLILTQSAG